MQTVVLIDVDEPTERWDFDRIEEVLGRAKRVVLCSTKRDPKIPLRLIPALSSAYAKGRVEIGIMPTKSVVNLSVFFWAGQLTANIAEDVHFTIVSSSEHGKMLTAFLQSMGRRAQTLNSEMETMEKSPTDWMRVRAQAGDVAARFDALNNYPKTKKALRHAIRNHFRKTTVDVAAVVEELVRSGSITMTPSGKVSYPGDSSEYASTAGLDDIPF